MTIKKMILTYRLRVTLAGFTFMASQSIADDVRNALNDTTARRECVECDIQLVA